MEVNNDSSLGLDISEHEFNLPRKDIDSVVDHAVYILKRESCNSKKKTHKIDALLEKLGFNVNELPSKTISEMRTVFEDNEIFNFNGVGSSELVSINPLYIVESLKTNQHLADLDRLKFQFEAMLSKFHHTNDVIQGELNREKAQADLLQEQINKKTVLRTNIKIKLNEVQREQQNLEALFKRTEKPRYTLENLNEMFEEVRRLEEDLAITSTRLKKYNNLPLSEKEAAKQLSKIKRELTDIDNEIQKKVG